MGPTLYRVLAFVVFIAIIMWLTTLGEKRKHGKSGRDPTRPNARPYVCPTCHLAQEAPGKCAFCNDETKRAA